MNYRRIYNKLIAKARVENTGAGYFERHHIWPRCHDANGAPWALAIINHPDNLVRLTPEQHCLAHLLLVKMYPWDRDLIHAAWTQTNTQGYKGTKNKTYGWMRRLFIENHPLKRPEDRTSQSERLKAYYKAHPEAGEAHSARLKIIQCGAKDCKEPARSPCRQQRTDEDYTRNARSPCRQQRTWPIAIFFLGSCCSTKRGDEKRRCC